MSSIKNYRYLIIGGGMTADAAVKGIRSRDMKSTIGLISSEPYLPYKRPPLSKSLWKGESEESIWLENTSAQTEYFLNTTAVSIDTQKKQVLDEKNTVYTYHKLLIATGGTVRKLPFQANGIIYFRTLEDYRKLRLKSELGGRYLVVGGGFIGSEIAAALAMNGHKVTMIFPEQGIGARVFPHGLSKFMNEYYESKGVKVIAKDGLSDISRKDQEYVVTTMSGREFTADTIIAGIGIEPNMDLAQQSGIQTNRGILVNEFLQTSEPDIYAAGDAASFMSPDLGMRLRFEHEDNALTMGEFAGRNMAGSNEPYHHLPFFYSDLFDLGYEAVGITDNHYTIVEEWKDKYRQGVVYYLDKEKLIGVLLWNTWDQVDHARSLIAEKQPSEPAKLMNRLPQ